MPLQGEGTIQTKVSQESPERLYLLTEVDREVQEDIYQ